jgi:hypothetical protein
MASLVGGLGCIGGAILLFLGISHGAPLAVALGGHVLALRVGMLWP